MVNYWLISRIDYPRSSSPSNFFISEFANRYLLDLDRRGKHIRHPDKVLHDFIYNEMDDVVQYVRKLVKSGDQVFYEFRRRDRDDNALYQFDIFDDVECLLVFLASS